MPIAHYVEQFRNQLANNPPTLTNELAVNLLGYFRALQPVPRIGFLVVGYDRNDPRVIGVDVSANTTQLANMNAATNQIQYGIIRGGDTAIVDRLPRNPSKKQGTLMPHTKNRGAPETPMRSYI